MKLRCTTSMLLSLLTFACLSQAEAPDLPPVDANQSKLTAGCAAANAGDHYEFLDDVCKKKRLPSDKSRFLGCPVVASSAAVIAVGSSKAVTYAPAATAAVYDVNALSGIVPSDVLVSLIVLRRVGGKVYARYLSNGTQDRTFYAWSASKFMAASVAATTLRAVSNNKAGLDASVRFNGQQIPLGDVVTAIANYDDSNGLSSNLSAKYFWNVGGRQKANNLLHGWLGRPANESIGANYGKGDQGLPYAFIAPDNSAFSVAPDSASFETRISTAAMAEFMKRLATHMDVAETRLPGMQRADIETLFYGAANSKLFAGRPGGLSADPSVYVHSGFDQTKAEAASRGKWRTFGKLGYGDSSDGTTNLVHNSYTCLPVLDSAGAPVADAGSEFVLSVRLAAPIGATRATDRKLGTAVQAVVARITDGRIR